MNVRATPRFRRQYQKAPVAVRNAFSKQRDLRLRDLRHRSLRAKRYDEGGGLRQARVNDDWRFYFTVDGDTYTLHAIRKHPKQP